MPERTDIDIGFGEKILRGWFYSPDAAPPWPAIVMAHGFSGVKEQRLDAFAEVFAERGHAVTVFDFPNLGASTGEPRYDIDPTEQVEAFETAISWTVARPDVDADRIGIWGTSYSGGHVLSLVSSDARIRCAVAQVPFVGPPMDQIPAPLEAMFAAERERGDAPPSMIPVVGSGFAALPTPDAEEWANQLAPMAPNWQNQVTLSSVDRLLHYRPAEGITDSASVPLLVVLAENDSLIPAAMVHEVFERAGEPKKLVTLDAGHFDVYLNCFDDAVQPEADWFAEHLVAPNAELLR